MKGSGMIIITIITDWIVEYAITITDNMTAKKVKDLTVHRVNSLFIYNISIVFDFCQPSYNNTPS